MIYSRFIIFSTIKTKKKVSRNCQRGWWRWAFNINKHISFDLLSHLNCYISRFCICWFLLPFYCGMPTACCCCVMYCNSTTFWLRVFSLNFPKSSYGQNRAEGPKSGLFNKLLQRSWSPLVPRGKIWAVQVIAVCFFVWIPLFINYIFVPPRHARFKCCRLNLYRFYKYLTGPITQPPCVRLATGCWNYKFPKNLRWTMTRVSYVWLWHWKTNEIWMCFHIWRGRFTDSIMHKLEGLIGCDVCNLRPFSTHF